MVRGRLDAWRGMKIVGNARLRFEGMSGTPLAVDFFS
jgi:hypothetical protein